MFAVAQKISFALLWLATAVAFVAPSAKIARGLAPVQAAPQVRSSTDRCMQPEAPPRSDGTVGWQGARQ